MNGVFITGTDTGIGKTLIAAAIAGLWVSRQIKVGVMKPIESGFPHPPDATDASDAATLMRFANSPHSLDSVCPCRLSLPLAPSVAARLESREIDLSPILRTYRRIQDDSQRVIVEGCGGLGVPITDKELVADLALQIGLPVLIVSRAGLGTINHTLLTVEFARSRGLTIAGIIMSHVSADEADRSCETNAAEIERTCRAPVLDHVPWMGDAERGAPKTNDDRIRCLIDRWIAQGDECPIMRAL